MQELLWLYTVLWSDITLWFVPEKILMIDFNKVGEIEEGFPKTPAQFFL